MSLFKSEKQEMTRQWVVGLSASVDGLHLESTHDDFVEGSSSSSFVSSSSSESHHKHTAEDMLLKSTASSKSRSKDRLPIPGKSGKVSKDRTVLKTHAVPVNLEYAPDKRAVLPSIPTQRLF